MQYNQKLDQFLNDTWLRSKTHKLISQSRKKILKDPLILKLNEYFKITYEQEISHMLPTLKKIIKKHTKQATTMIINELLNQSSKDAFFTFPITGHSNEFTQSSVISSNEYYDLGINIINKDELNQYKSESYKNIENRGIGFYGRHQLSYFIDAGGLEASAWEFPMGQNKQADELDLTSLKCNNPNNFRFKDSEFIYLQPNQTIMFEKAKKNVIMLTLEFKKIYFL